MESVFGSASILQCYCRREERITRGIPQEETLGAMIAAIYAREHRGKTV